MNLLTTITALAIVSISFGQEVRPLKLKPTTDFPMRMEHRVIPEAKIALPLKRMERRKLRKVEFASPLSKSIFGSFNVTHYRVLGLETPSVDQMDAITGSLVQVGNSKIVGTELEDLTIKINGQEEMSRGDYIFNTFGRSIRAPEPNLPLVVKVHKTNNADVFGIIELPDGRIAIPYKGLLLFLERGK